MHGVVSHAYVSSMRDAALTSALEIAGGPSALARHFRISPSAVIQWDRVPPGRVLDVERHTGVSRHALRPDIYGPLPQGDVIAPSADAVAA